MNMKLDDFKELSEYEYENIVGGGSDVFAKIWGAIEVFITIDDHLDGWVSDFKSGYNAYPYR